MGLTRPELEQFAAKEKSHFEQLLTDFVEIPSVSADPDREPDLERCAELGLATVRAFGGKADIHRVSGGPPVVLGSFGSEKGRLTVTVYNHLDVVPASKETEPWKTDPFTFVQEGDTYLGRGTTDDKGPALSALMGARAAMDAGVPINIKVLWEIEEEVGSPNFAETLRAIGPAAATDAVVVSDTVWVSRQRPAISSGLRGLQPLTLSLETGEVDQHSGTTGGVARNPVAELAQVVADIFDARTGRVKIPGFYDDVEKLTKEQTENFRKARPEHEGREDREAGARVPEEAAPGCAGRGGRIGARVQGHHHWALRRVGPGRDEVRLRPRSRLRARGRHHRRHPLHGADAPNENYDWHRAGGGIVAFAKFFEEVANH